MIRTVKNLGNSFCYDYRLRLLMTRCGLHRNCYQNLFLKVTRSLQQFTEVTHIQCSCSQGITFTLHTIITANGIHSNDINAISIEKLTNNSTSGGSRVCNHNGTKSYKTINKQLALIKDLKKQTCKEYQKGVLKKKYSDHKSISLILNV